MTKLLQISRFTIGQQGKTGPAGFYSSVYGTNCIAKTNNLMVDMAIESFTSNGVERTHFNPYQTLMKTDLSIGETYSFTYTATISPSPSPSPSPDYVQYIDETIKIIGIENINTHYGCFQDTLRYQEIGNVQVIYDDGTTQTNSSDITTWVLPNGLEVRRIIKADGMIITEDYFSDDMTPSSCGNQTSINSIYLLLLNNK